MKTFTFRYDPHPRRSAVAGIEKAVRTRKCEIQKDSLSCTSIEAMMKIMTKSRFQIFAAIVESEPESLSELADDIGKDLANVQRDVRALESLGLIELKRVAGKRGTRIQPFALYNRIVFECEPKRESKAG